MTEQTIRIYVSNDGQVFIDKEKCLAHERGLESQSGSALKRGTNYEYLFTLYDKYNNELEVSDSNLERTVAYINIPHEWALQQFLEYLDEANIDKTRINPISFREPGYYYYGTHGYYYRW